MLVPVRKSDRALQELGNRVGAVLLRIMDVECPRTRSALVVFDDLLSEVRDMPGLLSTMERLVADMDPDLVAPRAQLEQFTLDLQEWRSAKPDHFLMAYAQKRSGGHRS